MEERSRLVASGNLLQAHSWKGMLETCGITVELRGEALLGGVGELPADLQDVELWVGESQYDQALAQLETLNSVSPKWQCVKCHEINEGNFELCWNCCAERSELIS
ncbi:DUF2007 domain-containing protein [Shewanella sp. Isolate11]|uniref:putative signal transducing protein n=1 Tax=Shewanella sp. Isolate11 TaxID=2908530 RepID=UPI001EFC901E|nr:DUF2007 domain-containing protein [Shewanella sp. Isolate11]MCG9696371.1 DUF2007 domain-containing protein [Shewanella sp. Isolate11]